MGVRDPLEDPHGPVPNAGRLSEGLASGGQFLMANDTAGAYEAVSLSFF